MTGVWAVPASTPLFPSSCFSLQSRSVRWWTPRNPSWLFSQASRKLVTDFKNSANHFLDILKSRKIPAITFAGVDLQRAREPRETNPYWIGTLVSDEEETGYLLAKTLIAEALAVRSPGNRNPLLIADITGDPSSNMSADRVRGLERAVKEFSPQVRLVQTVPTFRWSQDEGYEKTKALLARYPDLKILWCANDDIALEALTAALSANP